jgi:two-component sensor histidine kinase
VPTLNDLVHDRTRLGEPDVEWLRQLVGDWQLLSDLSFADLVLWVAASDGGWLAVAHVRPTTGATVFFDDVVGTEVERGKRLQLDRAFDLGTICRESEPEWTEDVPVREETIPVVRAGRTIAVLSRHTELSSLRTPSRLEVTYMACGDALALMVSEGAFPLAGAPTGSRRGAPRVGDGLVRLDVDGVVVYASPNAVSAFHRLGHGRDLIGQSLAEITTPLLRTRGVVDEGLPLVLTGRAPWRCDLDGAGTTLSLRALPLSRAGERIGALLLLRDVTELRRRERELLSKDAMIREIHHRVKNNLQTVAALLRLQARRIDGGPARAALDEAVRRVGAIALVHETLSTGYDETVDFDEVAARGLSTIVEVASRSGSVRTQHSGRFGRLRAEDATALSLVLTELVQNAVEHGFDGRDGVVTVHAERRGEGKPGGADQLEVLVSDDGAGLPEGTTAPSGGLGTQIVRSLVTELRGTIEWRPRDGGGTEVQLRLRPRALD